jgi:hypothetical protein
MGLNSAYTSQYLSLRVYPNKSAQNVGGVTGSAVRDARKLHGAGEANGKIYASVDFASLSA